MLLPHLFERSTKNSNNCSHDIHFVHTVPMKLDAIRCNPFNNGLARLAFQRQAKKRFWPGLEWFPGPWLICRFADVSLWILLTYLRHPSNKSLQKCSQVSSDQSSKRSSPLKGGSSAQNMTPAMMTAQPGTTTLCNVRIKLVPIQHHGETHKKGFDFHTFLFAVNPNPSTTYTATKKSHVLVHCLLVAY